MSSYARVLRHHNFRCLFIGQAASVIGDQVVIVALAPFVTQRTGSPTDLGLILGAQSLALVALLLFGGVWADGLSRQRIMVVADTARGLGAARGGSRRYGHVSIEPGAQEPGRPTAHRACLAMWSSSRPTHTTQFSGEPSARRVERCT
jgi:hypothetical protein